MVRARQAAVAQPQHAAAPRAGAAGGHSARAGHRSGIPSLGHDLAAVPVSSSGQGSHGVIQLNGSKERAARRVAAIMGHLGLAPPPVGGGVQAPPPLAVPATPRAVVASATPTPAVSTPAISGPQSSSAATPVVPAPSPAPPVVVSSPQASAAASTVPVPTPVPLGASPPSSVVSSASSAQAVPLPAPIGGSPSSSAAAAAAALAPPVVAAPPPNPYLGAIVDREPGSPKRPVQGPLSLNAHRLLISRNLNIRSSNLNTFEAAARRLAQEREADEALQEESRARLQDPASSVSRLHLQIRTALAQRAGKQLHEIPDDVVQSIHAVRGLAPKGERGVVADRRDPTGAETHPTGVGAFSERDPGHLVLATGGLSSQSGTSGSAADAVRGLAALLGKGAVTGQEESVTRLAHLYMRDPRFYGGISGSIAGIKQGRGLPAPSAADEAALPASHTHSLGEIAQGVHLQTGFTTGAIDPAKVSFGHYVAGAMTGARLLAVARQRRRAAALAARPAALPIRAAL